MFIPNLTGRLRKMASRDIHGRRTFSPSVECPFAPVSLSIGAGKTTVRADSSASRGSSDETSVERGKILVPAFVEIKNGDVFEFSYIQYEIVAVHPRYSVAGIFDHWECDLETFLE